MSKSLEIHFLGLYRAILADYVSMFPNHRRDARKDYSKLVSHVSSMGVPVFLEHLPALRKHLDQCLDSGFATQSGLPLSRGNHSAPMIPRLFGGIWGEIFDEDGCLKDDINPEHVYFLRMLLSVSKKAKVEPPKHRLYAAIEEFYDVDEQLEPPTPFWEGGGSTHHPCVGRSYYGPNSGPQQSSDLFGADVSAPIIFRDDIGHYGLALPTRVRDRIQQVADSVAWSLGDFIPSDWSFKHGPGAVSNLSWDEYKYSFPGWSDMLGTVFPHSVFGISAPDLRDDCHDTLRTVSSSLPAAKLSAVPKDFKGPRLIASEPVENQWCQQAIKDFLYDRVRSTLLSLSIDFSNQSLSGASAIRASLAGDMCTMDLSAASDRISCTLVESLLRMNNPLLEAFRAVRTQYLVTNEDRKAPSVYRLRKFSTMGSALTFPVQSIIFFCVVVGCGLSIEGGRPTTSRLKRLARKVRIFGDDLIFPVEWEPTVSSALSALGLKVNKSKTFAGKNFRESCGADAFRGTLVTPNYIGLPCTKTQPETVASHVEVLNNLLQRRLANTFAYFRSAIPQDVRKHLPEVDRQSPVLGILSPFGFQLHPSAKVRYNRNLQRREFLAYVLKDRGRKRIHEGIGNLLEFFTRAAADPNRYDLYRTVRTGEVSDRGRKHKLALRWAPL